MEAVPHVVLVVELLVSRHRPQCGALCVECPGGSPVRRQSPNVVLIVCEQPSCPGSHQFGVACAGSLVSSPVVEGVVKRSFDHCVIAERSCQGPVSSFNRSLYRSFAFCSCIEVQRTYLSQVVSPMAILGCVRKHKRKQYEQG